MSTELPENGGLPSPPSANALIDERQSLLRKGQRLVLTNGCFDLLHPGHLHFLQAARSAGDVLWVALNADASVSGLKGPSRPVQNARERAFALSALRCVDRVFTFEGQRCAREIALLQPDIYAKAGDYTLETLDPGEREALQKAGSQILFFPFLSGYSTTRLIEKIHAAY